MDVACEAALESVHRDVFGEIASASGRNEGRRRTVAWRTAGGSDDETWRLTLLFGSIPELSILTFEGFDPELHSLYDRLVVRLSLVAGHVVLDARQFQSLWMDWNERTSHVAPFKLHAPHAGFSPSHFARFFRQFKQAVEVRGRLSILVSWCLQREHDSLFSW